MHDEYSSYSDPTEGDMLSADLDNGEDLDILKEDEDDTEDEDY